MNPPSRGVPETSIATWRTKLALFPHVAGSRVACGLFESAYVHPDGSTVYYHFTPGSYEEGADYRNEPPSPP